MWMHSFSITTIYVRGNIVEILIMNLFHFYVMISCTVITQDTAAKDVLLPTSVLLETKADSDTERVSTGTKVALEAWLSRTQ